MSAPVNEQVKAEAAKSLLERMAEKTKLVRFFRYNASAKHGVPIDAEEKIDIRPDECKEQEPQSEPSQNVVQIVKTDSESDERVARLERELEQMRKQEDQDKQPQSQQQETSPPATMSDKVKGILQTLAVLGGLGAAGYAGYAMTNGDTKENNDTNIEDNFPYYSPYQYLEDTGEHLP